jgi:hypothetical protein
MRHMSTDHLQEGPMGLDNRGVAPTENGERALGSPFDSATDGAVDDGHPLRCGTFSDPMQVCQGNGATDQDGAARHRLQQPVLALHDGLHLFPIHHHDQDALACRPNLGRVGRPATALINKPLEGRVATS